MTNILIAQGARADAAQIAQLTAELGASAEHRGLCHRFVLQQRPDTALLQQLRARYPFDINLLPAGLDPAQIRLLVTDMDSTLINIECIDEIADFLNLKPRIAEITELAMRGEIDFETSLRRRVGLLVGLSDSALHHVYHERLQLNPGAEQLLAGLKARRIRSALVSGGFSYFTERLKQRLGLDFTLANTLAFDDHGKLTGLGDQHIVGAERKAQFLLELCQRLGILPHQTIAMGDGANDLRMMAVAGLSIAYHAKPAVQQQADCVLNHCGLEGVLGLLDIAA
ncbi:MAG: phosphoserine phosphatase SerB [Gammaproteobacteria bacterium]|nr:phosphoserine phosphatase SerB [Gammaproteobacteria bacterium]